MKDDYSDVVFSPGLVCFNTNNNSFCVVISGTKGKENDRCSLVLEFIGEHGFMIHTAPNRALKLTGKIANIRQLKQILNEALI